MIYTFYSYKGGVGRTMAVANVAQLLSQHDLRVIVVDWDLESPELEHYFFPNTADEISHVGLVELINDFKEVMSQPPTETSGQAPVLSLPKIEKYLLDVKPESGQSLRLLPAGKRLGRDFAGYAKTVRLFDWVDFYLNWEGTHFFKWLRQELSQRADVVLINSSTGLNEMGAICMRQMANVVLLFCSSNQQSLLGTLKVASELMDVESLTGAGATAGAELPIERRGERVPVIIVPARIEESAEKALVEGFKNSFVERCMPFLPEDKRGKKEFNYFWDLRVPNLARFTFKDELVVGKQPTQDGDQIVSAFTKIAQAMARYAPPENPLSRLSRDGAAAVAAPPPPPSALGPYRGMTAFLEEHARLFFGRAEDIEKLLGQVEQGGIIPVIGQSGSGKSSLVQAGLLPRVRRGDLPGSEGWKIVTFKPDDAPFAALARSLAPLLRGVEKGAEVDAARLARTLENEPGSLARMVTQVLAQRREGARLLLFIDQFEELFTLARKEGQQVPFLNQLVDAADNSALTVVFTIRSDFYESCNQSPPFVEAIRGKEVSVRQMSREELKEAVLKPAELMGATFESGLDDRILADVGDEPGNLPLLQFALTRLWEERDGARLTHQVYARIGGVQEAIARRADTVFTNLSADEQQLARRILTQLVQLNGDGRNTRRRAAFRQLGEPADKVQEIVKTLADARLLVVVDAAGGDGKTPEQQIDVAHEALIQNWQRLQGWLDEDHKFLVWRQDLRRAADKWKEDEKQRGALLWGTSLKSALEWRDRRPDDLSHDDKEYIARSLRYRRLLRWARVGLGALIVAAVVGLGWWAREARRSKVQIIDASDYFARGSSAEQRGDVPAALENYTNAIEVSPDFPNPYVARGHIYLDRGERENALRDFEKALELNNASAPAWYGRALALAQVGRSDEAIQSYTRAIENDPGFYRAYVERGKIYYWRGQTSGNSDDLQRASEDFNQAVRLFPTYGEPYYHLGLFCEQARDYTSAVGNYSKAVEGKGDYAEAYHGRGRAYAALGDLDKAISDFAKAVEYGDQSANYNLGLAYQQKGEHERAVAAFDLAIRNDPENPDLYLRQGESHAQLGKHEEAIEDYTKSLELKPDQNDVYFSRGVAYAKAKKDKEAVADLRKFLSSPGDDKNLGEAGRLLDASGFRPSPAEVEIHLRYNKNVDGVLLAQIKDALTRRGFSNIRDAETTQNVASIRYFLTPLKYNARAIQQIIAKEVSDSGSEPQSLKVSFVNPTKRERLDWVEVWIPAAAAPVDEPTPAPTPAD